MTIIISIFFVLHGLVHVLYAGQSIRIFELQREMRWPDGSWAFSSLFGDEATRLLGSVTCVLAAIGFAAAGVAMFFEQSWSQPAAITSALFSTAVFILLWDGKRQDLDDKGGVGILINVAILVGLLVFKWPDFGY